MLVIRAPLLLLLPAVLLAAPAAARRELRPLPAAVLTGCAATAVRGELGLVESEPDGRARQITLIGYAAAPPALVRRLVADPALYPRYVRNLTRSDVERREDGAILNRWRLSYPIGSFEGTEEVRPLGGDGGPVEIRSLGSGKEAVARWEFLPVPGGGTLVVDYGYYDPLDNPFLRAMIGKSPELDAGFNLAGGLAVLRALVAEAAREARAAGLSITAPPPTRLDSAPLLARGTLAILRTDAQGGLVDVSVVDRVPLPAERMLRLVRAPESWPSLLRPVSRVLVTGRDAGGVDFRLTVAGFFFDVVTDFRMSFAPGGADALAVGGALRGARFRWDLSADGPGSTVAVWRGNVRLSDSSRLLRAMLRLEPSFEHSANISIGLMSVRSAVARAAALGSAPAD